MHEGLQNFISTKKQEGNLIKQGEEATKQGLILPVLHHLGWNPFDVQEVYPEYSIQNRRVDYSLRVNSYDKVFIEVKKIGEDLERHQEQLLSYAFRQGVKLAILTNGIIWWFYLPLHEGSWEQRRFYTIDLQSQSTIDITEKLTSFLSKPDVTSGRAVRNAENIYSSRQKGEIIQQALPKAWRKLLSENDDLLAELMAETVEKICGYKPEPNTVIQFLKTISGETSLPSVLRSPKPEVSTLQQNHINKIESSKYVPSQSFDNKKPKSFEFDGHSYEVHKWTDLLKTFVLFIAQKHPNDIYKLTSLVGKQRPYFTTNNQLLRKASAIPNSDIFFETHFSANGIVQLIGQILKTMNYDSQSIKINTTTDQS